MYTLSMLANSTTKKTASQELYNATRLLLRYYKRNYCSCAPPLRAARNTAHVIPRANRELNRCFIEIDQFCDIKIDWIARPMGVVVVI